MSEKKPLHPALDEARERLILALDFPGASEALRFVDTLAANTTPTTRLRWVKVGLELYLAAGSGIVAALQERDYSVFLDLKLHDIPNTVASAIRSLGALTPELLTIHASGGPAMLSAAADAAAALPVAPRLLAVTVLTSMDQQQLAAIGVAGSPQEQVLRLATIASEAGIPGLVCSAAEVVSLQSALPAMHLVTPGIRPAGADKGDQQRIATPAAAMRAGAAQLVIGRPITQAGSPAQALQAILVEMAEAIS